MTTEGGAEPRHPLTVLVVGGEANSVDGVAEILAKAGHVAIVTRSTEDARGCLSAARIDVLLLSVQVGSRVVRDVLALLADRRHVPPMVVISPSRLAGRTARGHAAEFLHRPFLAADLTELVERAGRRSSMPPATS